MFLFYSWVNLWAVSVRWFPDTQKWERGILISNDMALSNRMYRGWLFLQSLISLGCLIEVAMSFREFHRCSVLNTEEIHRTGLFFKVFQHPNYPIWSDVNEPIYVYPITSFIPNVAFLFFWSSYQQTACKFSERWSCPVTRCRSWRMTGEKNQAWEVHV